MYNFKENTKNDTHAAAVMIVQLIAVMMLSLLDN